MSAPEPTAQIEIDGRRFAWRTVGRGPRLLLLNGYAATGADWDPTFLAALAESFEVICPDNRGVGGSELGEGELTIDGMAADAEALLEALEVEALPVVGWSMGGFVAQRLATRSPGRVAALALLSTDPGGPAAVPADPDVWDRLRDHSGTPREQASRLIGLLFPPAVAAEIDREFGDLVAAARAELSAATLRAQEAAMEAWHEHGQATPPGDPPPTLVAHGRQDAVVPVANAALLADRWSAVRVEVFDGGGHAVMAQEPSRLVESIVAVLG
jgi:pimeloyl-ACP methyl ester carboxylesterase